MRERYYAKGRRERYVMEQRRFLPLRNPFALPSFHPYPFSLASTFRIVGYISEEEVLQKMSLLENMAIPPFFRFPIPQGLSSLFSPYFLLAFII